MIKQAIKNRIKDALQMQSDYWDELLLNDKNAIFDLFIEAMQELKEEANIKELIK